MAAAKFCSMLGLAAMLVCLLIRMVACYNEQFTAEESETLLAMFAKELDSEEALKRLESIKDEYGSFHYSLYSVNQLLAMKDYTLDKCDVIEFEDMKLAVRKLATESIGLYNYIKESYVRFAKLCANNYEEILRRNPYKTKRRLVEEITRKLSGKKKLRSRDYQDDTKSACLLFNNSDMLLKRRLEEVGLTVNIAEHWQTKFEACEKYLENYPELKQRYSSSSGSGYGYSSGVGMVLPAVN